MTANQTQFGYGAEKEYSAHVDYSATRTFSREEIRGEKPPVMYIYGDRVCRKEAKQKQLYKQYGAAAGFAEYDPSATRKKRYKIVIDSIINLFDSIEERWKQDVEAAKTTAIKRKKLLEHKRGIILALFTVGLLSAFAVLGYHFFFGISNIYAENTVNYNGEEIIAASGVDLGDKLYSFRADVAEEKITFVCPYVRSVEVERTIPNQVSFALESDQAAYCVNIYGEMLVLSEGLRVLGRYNAGVNGVLPELCLPEVSYSVEGRAIRFADEKNERFVREILSCIRESGMADRIDLADLRDAYAVELQCDGLYLLKMGGEKSFADKLKMAEKTLADSDIQKDTPAEIELSIVNEASILYDHTLDLTSHSRES